MKMISSSEWDIRLEQLMPLIREQLELGKKIRISPRGNSMLPMIRQETDSVVLTSLPQKIKKYDIPLYQRDNGKYILHRIVQIGERYTCIGDNQFHTETGVRRDQMVAVVSGFYRGERFYDVSGWKYWLYCRFWHYSRPFRYLWCRGINVLRRNLP